MSTNTRVREWCRLVAVVVVVCGPTGFGGKPGEDTEGLVLAADGKALSEIVVPVDPSSTITRAAKELSTYLNQICGIEFPVVVEDGRGPDRLPIDVGPTRRARGIAANFGPGAPEEFVIRVSEDGVAICGATDRSTLFAVYRFLEDKLGCRWLAADAEHVPSEERPTVALGNVRTRPAFTMRTFVGRRRETLSTWGTKVGLNGLYTQEVSRENGGCYYLPNELPGCHTYTYVIPNDPYFRDHPEWFPLIGGIRRPGNLHGAQLCVTATGLADEFAANIIRIFDQDPACNVTSISPNDGRGWCECDACSALDQRLCGGRMTQQGLAGERPFRGDRVFWFANEVASRVARKHPDKLLLVLAYINYAEPPDTVVPLPNVVPYLCHYAPADYSRSISDPSSEANRQFNVLLKAWAERAPHLLFYSYVSKSMWWRLPRPILHTFAADVRHLYTLGIRRYYAQSSLSDWALDGPLYYVLAKMLWDPSQSPDALAADWTEHMFGPAAQPMLRFYAEVEGAVTATGGSYSDNPPTHVPGLYDPQFLDRASNALDEAVSLAQADPFAARVRKIQDVFRYGRLVIRGLEAAQRFKDEADVDAIDEVQGYLSEALAICRVREASRFVDTYRFFTEIGVVATGFGDREEKGGRSCWNTDETGLGDNKAGWATFLLRTPGPPTNIIVEMDVWGESDLSSIVVNTGGKGLSYAQGGIWTPKTPEQALTGKPGWETLRFPIGASVLAPGRAANRVGMGGADSQIWIAAIRVSSKQ